MYEALVDKTPPTARQVTQTVFEGEVAMLLALLEDDLFGTAWAADIKAQLRTLKKLHQRLLSTIKPGEMGSHVDHR